MIDAIDTVGRSLQAGLGMFWETLWALVLGFTLSGAVQAFVSKEDMQRVLGDHRPATVGRASLLGMVSSSCSYAATAMAKSLFQRGADFLTSMVFMFASTNLVVELGAEWVGNSHTRIRELCGQFGLELFNNQFETHLVYKGKYYYVYSLWFTVYSLWFMVYGLWFMNWQKSI